jgi:hypothetical protein
MMFKNDYWWDGNVLLGKCFPLFGGIMLPYLSSRRFRRELQQAGFIPKEEREITP